MKRLSPEEELVAARNLTPDDCDIAAVGGARRCVSCGRPGGGHEIDCQRARRLEREKLQAECDHRSETVTRTTGDPPGPPCCGRCGLELPEPARRNSPWIFTQNSTPSSTCPHEQITLANDEVPTLCCRSCGKRWTFVPAGETPRYRADDDPTYPGMLDNRGWSKSTRVAVMDVDEILAKVGMMTDARTPEMQARYDAAVERERAPKTEDNGLRVTIAGTQAEKKTVLARAILELLQEADIPCAMPEEAENPYDGDSIEQLGHLRGVGRVIVQTGGAA